MNAVRAVSRRVPLVSWAARPRMGTLASAALMTGAFPPFEAPGFIWVAFVPWLWAVSRSASIGAAIGQGLWLSVLFGLAAGSWIADAAVEYLQVSYAVGLVALFFHVAIHQLQLLLFAPVFRMLVRGRGAGEGALRRAALVPVGALGYVGLDWAVPKLLRDSIGLLLHDYSALSQAAELGGIYLLTFLVLAVNLAIFCVVREGVGPLAGVGARLVRVLPGVVVAAVLLAGFALFGALRLAEWREKLREPGMAVRVGLVQGSVSRELKRRWAVGDIAAARESLATYQRTTDTLLEREGRLDLVVWPETAYPGIFREPETQDQLELNIGFDRYIANRGVPFVFGAYDIHEPRGARLLRNGLFFVEPTADQDSRSLSPMTVHHKSRLFPIGEYIPLLDLPSVRQWLPGAGALSVGGGPALYEIQLSLREAPLRIGPAICYEDLFGDHTATLARLGAELIVNVSNDSWFGDRGEPRLHLIVARLRSIETRLPQVRATNTGYSALILPTGELLQATRYGERRALAASIPIRRPEPTWATRSGDAFGPVSLVLALVAVFVLRPGG